MKEKGHYIKKVESGSIAEEMEIEAGDYLLAINGEEVQDIFDYQFLVQEEYIEVLLRKPSGEEWILEIDKEYEDELGIVFENGLMDEYRTCKNKCIFCFIDQMPGGMRETLYFKDDDSRLSFLQGNYVTLTNMSDEDVQRIIKYHLSPINISFQTTNPQLRCKMLNNRYAGDALKKAELLYQAGIAMNGQIVLCRGINDGEELERSIRDLTEYLPYLESVSVVPVGLSKFREGLYPLEPFSKEDAEQVLLQIERWQEDIYREQGTHFIHASDEWYILAQKELPEADTYDGYPQLENGVGMLRLLLDEFEAALTELTNSVKLEELKLSSRSVSVATGKLAYPYIQKLCRRLEELLPLFRIQVYLIKNQFFGENITVTGLLTGEDIKGQLYGKNLEEKLFLPWNVLRCDEAVFLDDMTIGELESSLQVPIDIVKSSGQDFVNQLIGID